MTRTIDLLGKTHEINVQRKYKNVWVAVGQYMGRRFEVKAKTETDAVDTWREVATSKGSP